MTGEMRTHRAQKSRRRRGGRKRCTKRLLVWSNQLEKGLTFVDKNLNHVFGYWWGRWRDTVGIYKVSELRSLCVWSGLPCMCVEMKEGMVNGIDREKGLNNCDICSDIHLVACSFVWLVFFTWFIFNVQCFWRRILTGCVIQIIVMSGYCYWADSLHQHLLRTFVPPLPHAASRSMDPARVVRCIFWFDGVVE